MLSRPKRAERRAARPMATTMMVRPRILLVSFFRHSWSLALSPWAEI